MGKFTNSVYLISFIYLISTPTYAADAPAAPATPAVANTVTGNPAMNIPKPIDGVQIEAVETYWTPKPSELSVGIGVYPFDAYTTGLSINVGYIYHWSRNLGWEIVNGSIFTTFDKGLTTQLADQFNLNPGVIERVQFIVASNLCYVFAYGKFVLLEDYIKYFRITGLVGASLVDTSLNGYVGPDFGIKFEIFSGKTFSWKLETRDAIGIANTTNYVTFTLGMGISF